MKTKRLWHCRSDTDRNLRSLEVSVRVSNYSLFSVSIQSSLNIGLAENKMCVQCGELQPLTDVGRSLCLCYVGIGEWKLCNMTYFNYVHYN